ncbi:MAG: ABC transporter substrate-binding protein [Bacteroidetes bacterium]|nr:ABC transporter substrate-binding protein [Bacteroidota bacterium]
MRLFIALCFVFVPLLTAQDSLVYHHPSEELFLQGMRQFAQKEYRPALTLFRQSMAALPFNHRTTAALIMAAKSELAMRNYRGAMAACDALAGSFPQSQYQEDVLFTRGMSRYHLGDNRGTFEDMAAVYRIAQQPANRDHAARMIEHLAQEYMTEELTAPAVTDTLPPYLRNLLIVVAAEVQFQNGSADGARAAIARFIPAEADQALQFRINRLLARIEKGNQITIGVLLPLHRAQEGETREKRIVNEMLEGITLAVSDYEERTVPGQVSVQLDVRDSEKDSAVIRTAIQAWGDDPLVTGIIGPVFSAETMIAARFAQEKELPIVTPTATDEGISSIGPFVFQANSTNGAKGKTMAQYAVNVLGAKTIAVLGSAVPSSSTQADSFIAEAKRLGASVIADRRYKKGESDIRSYVRSIRADASALRPDYVVAMRGKVNVAEVSRRLVSLGIKFSYIDSIVAAGGLVNFTSLFGDSAKRIADSLRLPVKKTSLYVDSLHYPVTAVDLIYCPIANSHEVGVITSQLAFYNIRATILGSGDWNDPNELDLNKRYADGVIFGSDRWVERNDRTLRIFGKYARKYGRQMSDNALFGFDAMSMILTHIGEGAVTRRQLADALASVFEYPGIRNAVSLRQERVNSALQILQFRNGAVTRLHTYSSQ